MARNASHSDDGNLPGQNDGRARTASSYDDGNFAVKGYRRCRKAASGGVRKL